MGTKIYKKPCRFCGQIFEAMYEKALANQVAVHELYCVKKQAKLLDGGK